MFIALIGINMKSLTAYSQIVSTITVINVKQILLHAQSGSRIVRFSTFSKWVKEVQEEKEPTKVATVLKEKQEIKNLMREGTTHSTSKEKKKSLRKKNEKG